MAITQFFNDEPLPNDMPCVICGRHIPSAEATAGLLDVDNQQQFACNGHFWNPHQFIAGWADFMAAERVKQTHDQFAFEYGEVPDARTLC